MSCVILDSVWTVTSGSREVEEKMLDHVKATKSTENNGCCQLQIGNPHLV